ncbi:MAG: ATP synthase subunit I [Stenotrophobium sp.]
MRRDVYKLLMIQSGLTVVAALGMYFYRDALGATLYGGAIALINALLLARRTVRAAAMVDRDARWSSFTLLAGVLERFLFTLAAFGLGIGVLRLDPPALIVGFAVAQIGYVLARPRSPGVQV